MTSVRSRAVRILYLAYTNPAAYPPLEHSSRIFAEAGTIVLVLGTARAGDPLELPPHAHLTVKTVPFQSAGWRQKAHYAGFTWWAGRECLKFRPDCIYVSDPLAAPAALVLTRLCPGAMVVYHEHDSPSADPGPRSFFMRVIRAARRRLAHRADCCVLPNDERAAVFADEHPGADVVTVWNCPRREEAMTPRPIGVSEGLRVLYQGSIVPSRVPKTVIEALRSVPERVTLTLVGYETVGHPGYVDDLLRFAQACGVGRRVRFVGVVPRRDEMMRICASCDVGLSLFPVDSADFNERRMVGASNKPFDYMACGLPLVVGSLPEWQATFVAGGFARDCHPATADSIADVLRWFDEHPRERRAMGEAGRRQIHECWNYERTFAPVARRILGDDCAIAAGPSRATREASA